MCAFWGHLPPRENRRLSACFRQQAFFEQQRVRRQRGRHQRVDAAGIGRGIEIGGGTVEVAVGTLILAGALLGIINAIVRPIAIILTLPITILSLGFFLLVVNAGMVALVAGILPGFHIPGGFWSAFGTALIVWITSWVGSWLIGPRGKIDVYVRKL